MWERLDIQSLWQLFLPCHCPPHHFCVALIMGLFANLMHGSKAKELSCLRSLQWGLSLKQNAWEISRESKWAWRRTMKFLKLLHITNGLAEFKYAKEAELKLLKRISFIYFSCILMYIGAGGETEGQWSDGPLWITLGSLQEQPQNCQPDQDQNETPYMRFGFLSLPSLRYVND